MFVFYILLQILTDTSNDGGGNCFITAGQQLPDILYVQIMR